MQDTDTTTLYGTNSCCWCGDIGEVEVPSAGLLAYHNGALIQDVFPDLDKSLREQIISGTHPECWKEMYG